MRFLFVIVLVLCGCSSEPTFYYLPLNSGPAQVSAGPNLEVVTHYSEAVLVSNYPSDKASLKTMMLTYQKEKGFRFENSERIALYDIGAEFKQQVQQWTT